MNKILLILLFLQITSAHSFEIQCQSNWDDVLMVLKTSPETNRTYLLFLNDDGVEKYWNLPQELISNTDLEFTFQEKTSHIYIDKVKNEGEIKGHKAIFRGQSDILLSNCIQF